MIRKLKAAEGEGLPASAVQPMLDAVGDKLMREIVEDNRRTSLPGWLPPGPAQPVVRGTGWQSPGKHEDRSRQFAMFDAMIEGLVGGPNDTSKLR